MLPRAVNDASFAEAAVTESLRRQYGNNLKGLLFRKCWYSYAGRQEFWDIEGTFVYSRGMLGRETKNFHYQVDPETGRVIGYEVLTPESAPLPVKPEKKEKKKRSSNKRSEEEE